MSFTVLATNLLAQFSRWERLGDGLHRSRGKFEVADAIPYLVVFGLIAAAATAVVMYIKYNDMSKPCDDPQKLFRELSKAHGLDRGSQRLLRQLATALGYAQPARVFVTPAAFEAKKLPDSLYDEREKLLALRERLF